MTRRRFFFYPTPVDLLRERSFGASTARLLLKFDPSRREVEIGFQGRAPQDRCKRTLKSRRRLSRFRGDLSKFFRLACERPSLKGATEQTSKFSDGNIEFQDRAAKGRLDRRIPATTAYAPRYRRIYELTFAGRRRSRVLRRALRARK